LTDNGSEFFNPKAIEYGPESYNNFRTRIYYYDAGCPYQKGAIEVIMDLCEEYFLEEEVSIT
jgi:IS30 family transposase